MNDDLPIPSLPVLITGASGKLGRDLIPSLIARGWRLRLTDIAPFPDPLPANAEFIAADLNDREAMLRLAQGCACIVHFGGLVEYGTFETVLGPNLRGVHHVFEAALAHGLRVVYASSNHVIGFHERETVLDKDCTYRPDSYYGLSKVFGEMVARFFWDRNGVESVSLRIGSCFPEPKQERMLATWLSREDMARLVAHSVTAASTGCAVVWGVSNNRASWWQGDDRARIGWAPRDSADAYQSQFPPPGDSPADRFQGGGFCEIGYTRG
ncbi:NAD-dependent epimerase/dehydratase family protein [Hydrogenophaga sp. BPS33]|uniref:NAD-dependent epimerase/dehydratase family protein n=1 Tax=Hydrogenophaga sp. BPS33 TaxID=2651974 RepID=UPI00131FEA0A|nr:NAD(P)-dependent oxidoreductase [Hydrogenophaga sp. BPS33]QHE83440.1 NAD(P)-dependent oxidoreductase [Hydrogenophaga sp. BPS33]